MGNEDQSDDVVITEMIQTVEDHFEEINFVEPPTGSIEQKISLKSAYKKGTEKCQKMRRSSSRENESKTSCYSAKNGRPLISRQTTKCREPLLNHGNVCIPQDQKLTIFSMTSPQSSISKNSNGAKTHRRAADLTEISNQAAFTHAVSARLQHTSKRKS